MIPVPHEHCGEHIMQIIFDQLQFSTFGVGISLMPGLEGDQPVMWFTQDNRDGLRYAQNWKELYFSNATEAEAFKNKI
jgi:cell wall assembly regulator SMI1